MNQFLFPNAITGQINCMCVCVGGGGDIGIQKAQLKLNIGKFFLLKGKGAELHLEKCVVTELML